MVDYTEYNSLKRIVGRTIVSYDTNKDNYLEFTFSDGSKTMMQHDNDCCESVYIEDINGDLNNLLNTPLLVAEERASDDFIEPDNYSGLQKWTFYCFRTIKGSVYIRWYARANGYYGVNINMTYTSSNGKES